MRVIMCKQQFEQHIIDEIKLSTIRKNARCKPGDLLSIRKWAGKPYRSKHVIIKEINCQSVHNVRISDIAITVYPDDERIIIPMGNIDSSRFAKMEGFSSSHEMILFFEKTHGLPVSGDLIYWGEQPLNFDFED